MPHGVRIGLFGLFDDVQRRLVFHFEVREDLLPDVRQAPVDVARDANFWDEAEGLLYVLQGVLQLPLQHKEFNRIIRLE